MALGGEVVLYSVSTTPTLPGTAFFLNSWMYITDVFVEKLKATAGRQADKQQTG